MKPNTYPFMDQHVTSQEALRVAADYIALAFNRDDRQTPRHSIPVQADDHDMVLTRYIKQTTALLERAEKVLLDLFASEVMALEIPDPNCGIPHWNAARALLRDLRDGSGS